MRDTTDGPSPAAKRDRWPSEDELARLVRAAQRGEAGALDALLAQLRPAFMAYLSAGMTRDEAEDLAQLGLIRIAAALERIDPERAQVYTIVVARNLLRRGLRQRALEAARRAPVELAYGLEVPVTPEQEVESRELVDAIRRHSRATLPREQGEIVLGLLAGLSQAEIAARQARPGATVRTWLRAARARLRAELRVYCDGLRESEEPTSRTPRLVHEECQHPGGAVCGARALIYRPTPVVHSAMEGPYSPSKTLSPVADYSLMRG